MLGCRQPTVFAAVVNLMGVGLISVVTAADTYKLDKSHTKVGFRVRHLVISNVRGEFTDYDATIQLDEKDPTKSSLQGTIKTASINTNNETRDKHLRSDDFFNADQHPEITFKSKRIEKKGDAYVMVGDLTLRGMTKEIQLPFTMTGPINHKNRRRIGFEADLVINRQDYGVKYNSLADTGGLAVGNEVTIELNGEAIKQ